MAIIGDAALEARCRTLVDDLPLPVPFTVTGLVEAVARQVSRPVQLRPLPLALGPEVSGMVARTDVGYLVRYPSTGAPWWALVCLSHELAHILCGHLTGPTRQALTAAADPDTHPAGAPLVEPATNAA